MLWKEQGRDTMHLVGRLGDYLSRNGVDVVVIDDTGVGGGVVDRLREMGTGSAKLVAFNGGARARKTELYANSISEAWMEMRDWFLSGAADIEEDRELVGQLSSRGYAYQSDRRIIIDSKRKMEHSPDEADALAMTFAAPQVEFRLWV